jgi:hypothetical protein
MWGLFGRVGSLLAPLGKASARNIPQALRSPGKISLGSLLSGGLAGASNVDFLIQGSNVLQQPLKNIFGIPTTGDYLRQWEKQELAKRRPVGTLATLNGNEVEWRGPDLGWQRTYSDVRQPPPGAADQPLTGFSGAVQAGQATPPAAPPPPGAAVMSNGAGVPAQRQNVLNRSLSQEVLNAAQQYAAPTSVPLSSFYEGQQQLGRSMIQKGNLVSELQALGGAAGMTPENLQKWAQANPELAYREMLRLKGRQ